MGLTDKKLGPIDKSHFRFLTGILISLLIGACSDGSSHSNRLERINAQDINSGQQTSVGFNSSGMQEMQSPNYTGIGTITFGTTDGTYAVSDKYYLQSQ